MGGGQMKTPARWQAQPGQEGRFATAASTLEIAQSKAKRHHGGTAYTVTATNGEDFRVVVSGRVQWALDRLH